MSIRTQPNQICGHGGASVLKIWFDCGVDYLRFLRVELGLKLVRLGFIEYLIYYHYAIPNFEKKQKQWRNLCKDLARITF